MKKSRLSFFIALMVGIHSTVPAPPALAQASCGCEVKARVIDPKTGRRGKYFDCVRRNGESFTQWVDSWYKSNGEFGGYNVHVYPKGCVAKEYMNSTQDEVVNDMASNIAALQKMLGLGGNQPNGNTAAPDIAARSESTTSSALPSIDKLTTLIEDPRQKEYMGYIIKEVDYQNIGMNTKYAEDMLSTAPQSSGIGVLRNAIYVLDKSPQWSYYTYIMKSTIQTPTNRSLVFYKICFDVRGTNRINTTGNEEVIADEGMTSLEKQSATRLAVWSVFYSFKTKCGALTADTLKAYESKIMALK